MKYSIEHIGWRKLYVFQDGNVIVFREQSLLFLELMNIFKKPIAEIQAMLEYVP